MRGTSGSVRRSPANPARPGREQRYRDHFVRRGVPEVPLICSAQAFSSGAGCTYSRPVEWSSVKLWELCIRVFGFQHRGTESSEKKLREEARFRQNELSG